MPEKRRDFDQKFDQYLNANGAAEDGASGAQAVDLSGEQKEELATAAWLARGKKNLNPRPGFVAASRRRVIERISREVQPRVIPAHTAPAKPHSTFAQIRRIALQSVLAALLLIVLTANTNSIQASAKASFPGDAFYPLKLAGEELQAGLTFSPAKHAGLYTRFAQRRLADLAALVLEGRYEQLPATSDRCVTQIDRAVEAVQALAQTDPAQARIFARQLEEVVFKQAEVLELLQTAVPVGYEWTIQDVLAASGAGHLRLEMIFATTEE